MSELHGILVAKFDLDSFLWMILARKSALQHVSAALSFSFCEYWILVSYNSNTNTTYTSPVLTQPSVTATFIAMADA